MPFNGRRAPALPARMRPFLYLLALMGPVLSLSDLTALLFLCLEEKPYREDLSAIVRKERLAEGHSDPATTLSEGVPPPALFKERYHFVPTPQGVYSFALSGDLPYLVRQEIIALSGEGEETSVELLNYFKAGLNLGTEEECAALRRILTPLTALAGDALILKAMNRHPDYACLYARPELLLPHTRARITARKLTWQQPLTVLLHPALSLDEKVAAITMEGVSAVYMFGEKGAKPAAETQTLRELIEPIGIDCRDLTAPDVSEFTGKRVAILATGHGAGRIAELSAALNRAAIAHTEGGD